MNFRAHTTACMTWVNLTACTLPKSSEAICCYHVAPQRSYCLNDKYWTLGSVVCYPVGLTCNIIRLIGQIIHWLINAQCWITLYWNEIAFNACFILCTADFFASHKANINVNKPSTYCRSQRYKKGSPIWYFSFRLKDNAEPEIQFQMAAWKHASQVCRNPALKVINSDLCWFSLAMVKQ